MGLAGGMCQSPMLALLLVALLGLQSVAHGYIIRGCVDRPPRTKKNRLAVYCYDRDWPGHRGVTDEPGRVPDQDLPPETKQEEPDRGEGGGDETRSWGPPSRHGGGGRDKCEDDDRSGDDLIGSTRTNRYGCFKLEYPKLHWDTKGRQCLWDARYPDIYCVVLKHKTRTYKNWNPKNILTLDPLVVP